MRAQITTFAVLFLVLCNGCSKDDNPSSDGDKNASSHIYPLAVGNQWIYSVGDTITINRTATLNGKLSHCINGDDDYTFGERNLYYEGSVLYGWENIDTVASQIFDESVLESLPKEKITVQAGTFDTYKYNLPQSTTYYWFAKGYGVVKVEYTSRSEIRELVKYTIK
jgi:hypothetical protein